MPVADTGKEIRMRMRGWMLGAVMLAAGLLWVRCSDTSNEVEVAHSASSQPPASANVEVGPPEAPGWPAADPSKLGPFKTVIERNVGPDAAFTLFRPEELTRRYPLITWGNGTGASPEGYAELLKRYASHGFIVIASNSGNVGRSDPPPMLLGVSWVLEQDLAAGTTLFQHVDREQIGATGHSQGAFATSRAGRDERIKTIAAIEGLGNNTGLHGPVLALCGALDPTIPCSTNLSAFMGVTDQPAMYAELLSADHLNWIQRATQDSPSPFWTITIAWFRVHLMNDTLLRPMFYGECSVCKDRENWVTLRRGMED